MATFLVATFLAGAFFVTAFPVAAFLVAAFLRDADHGIEQLEEILDSHRVIERMAEACSFE